MFPEMKAPIPKQPPECARPGRSNVRRVALAVLFRQAWTIPVLNAAANVGFLETEPKLQPADK